MSIKSVGETDCKGLLRAQRCGAGIVRNFGAAHCATVTHIKDVVVRLLSAM